MGQLIPCFVQDILPGDMFRVNTQALIRMAPMLAPVMDEVRATVHFFFVPHRLVWNEFETFITGGPDGTEAPVAPYIPIKTSTAATVGNFTESSLWDYLGLPTVSQGTTVNDEVNISSLLHRSYQLVFNEYYRDQNLSNPVDIPLTSGSDEASLSALRQIRNRAWEKDYFTSALPFAQRGAAVTVPVEGIGEATYLPQSNIFQESGMNPDTLANVTTGSLGDPSGLQASGDNVRIENIDEISLTSANFTINMLRYAIRLQEWLEKNAIGGGRYVEQILSHFGVISSDARLQRPEFIGGGIFNIRFSEVLSTVDDSETPQGNMAGHGIGFGNAAGFKRRFEEHGYVLGIISVQPKPSYCQGIPKHFLRPTKLDYAWPEFGHLGEQEVKPGEIFYDPAAASGTNVGSGGLFGYQSRFAEYKFQPSTVHGSFRTSLDYWHMARKFPTAPLLNQEFVTADPTKRIFAVQDEDVEDLYCTVYHKVDAIRALPYFGTPML